jgi:hypothetical protein
MLEDATPGDEGKGGPNSLAAPHRMNGTGLMGKRLHQRLLDQLVERSRLDRLKRASLVSANMTPLWGQRTGPNPTNERGGLKATRWGFATEVYL